MWVLIWLLFVLHLGHTLSPEYSFHGRKCVCPKLECPPQPPCPKIPNCPPSRPLLVCTSGSSTSPASRVVRVVPSTPFPKDTDGDVTPQPPLPPYKLKARHESLRPPQHAIEDISKGERTVLVESFDFDNDYEDEKNQYEVEAATIATNVGIIREKDEAKEWRTVGTATVAPSGGRFYSKRQKSNVATTLLPAAAVEMQRNTSIAGGIKADPSVSQSVTGTTSSPPTSTTASVTTVSSTVTTTLPRSPSTTTSQPSITTTGVEYEYIEYSAEVPIGEDDGGVKEPQLSPVISTDDGNEGEESAQNSQSIPGFDSIVADVSVPERTPAEEVVVTSTAVSLTPTTQRTVVVSEPTTQNPNIAPSGYKSSVLFGSESYTFDPTKCNSDEWMHLLLKEMKISDANESKKRISLSLGEDALQRVSVLCSKTTISFRLVAARYCQLTAGDSTCLLFEP